MFGRVDVMEGFSFVVYNEEGGFYYYFLMCMNDDVYINNWQNENNKYLAQDNKWESQSGIMKWYICDHNALLLYFPYKYNLIL